MDWPAVVAFGAALICLSVLASAAWLFWRRRHLGSGQGSFECHRRQTNDDSPWHWRQGIARYRGDALLWYPLLSFGLQPKSHLLRLRLLSGPRRWPSAAERAVLYEGQQILRLQDRVGGDVCDLAMSPAAVNGLLAWIEAAPPGEGQYGHTRAPGGGLPPGRK
ncbi:MAG: DUF2550 domain-containing protein [Propionibacteriaceae bacterium]|jgi:hypothetical protein|nr:DUF2550 domain-containing protein [Propionibacteriaceae bacterium]